MKYTPLNKFPEYDENPSLPFAINFISPRTVRIRFSSRSVPFDEKPSLMLAGELPKDNSWKISESEKQISYKNESGEVRIIKNPWHIEFYDNTGKLLTRTQNISDTKTYSVPIPFSFKNLTISYRLGCKLSLRIKDWQ